MILRTSFAAAVLAIDSICCLSYHSWRREMSVDRLAEVDAPSKANSEAGHSWSTDGITNAYDSAAYTACFIIWQSALNTHLFSCAPVLVSPGSEWWRSAEFLEEKEKKLESVLQYTLSWAWQDDSTFHVPIWGMKSRKIAWAPQIKILVERDGSFGKCFLEFNSTRRRHTLLSTHLESIDSRSLCSIRRRVHLRP